MQWLVWEILLLHISPVKVQISFGGISARGYVLVMFQIFSFFADWAWWIWKTPQIGKYQLFQIAKYIFSVFQKNMILPSSEFILKNLTWRDN